MSRPPAASGRGRRRGGSAARRAERRPRAAARKAPPGGLARKGGSSSGGESGGKGGSLVIACGALAREILQVKQAHGLAGLEVHCLPAEWHNTPQRIPEGVRARIRQARAEGFARILVAYGDCGTGGALDAVLAEEGAERLPGAHCYAFYSGVERFMEGIAADARSFFLTDYLVRHFDALIWRGLMLDVHPELAEQYFGNYEKLVHLAQSDDAELAEAARAAAARLGLAFERRFTGPGDLEKALVGLARPAEGGEG